MGERLGISAPAEIAFLKESYYDRVAPLVAVWLTEVKLILMGLVVDGDFGDSELDDGLPTRSECSHSCLTEH